MLFTKRTVWACLILSILGLLRIAYKSEDSVSAVSDYVLGVKTAVSQRIYDTHDDAQPSAPGTLHVVFSSTDASAKLCRSFASAVAVGYPGPVLVRLPYSDGLSHTQRDSQTIVEGLESTMVALSSLAAERPADFVILVNGNSVWFQLGPQILLSRYYALMATAGSGGVRDDVLVANNGNATSGSSFRADVVMGSITAVGNLLHKARQALLDAPGSTTLDSVIHSLSDSGEHSAPSVEPTSEVDDSEPNRALNIVVDSDGDLFFSHSDTHDSTSWISQEAGTIGASSRLFRREASTLPADIAGSLRPFYTDLPDDRFPAHSSWEEQTLLTATASGKVPAIILDDYAESNDKHGWHNLWFVQKLAHLLWYREREIVEGPAAYADNRFWWPARGPGTHYRVFQGEDTGQIPMEKLCGGDPVIVTGS